MSLDQENFDQFNRHNIPVGGNLGHVDVVGAFHLSAQEITGQLPTADEQEWKFGGGDTGLLAMSTVNLKDNEIFQTWLTDHIKDPDATLEFIVNTFDAYDERPTEIESPEEAYQQDREAVIIVVVDGEGNEVVLGATADLADGVAKAEELTGFKYNLNGKGIKEVRVISASQNTKADDYDSVSVRLTISHDVEATVEEPTTTTTTQPAPTPSQPIESTTSTPQPVESTTTISESGDSSQRIEREEETTTTQPETTTTVGVPTDKPTEGLADTGTNVEIVAATGLALAGLGSVLVRAARRIRR